MDIIAFSSALFMLLYSLLNFCVLNKGVSHVDIFYEQLVSIKNNSKNLMMKTLIWFLTALVIVLLFLFIGYLQAIGIALIFGAGYLGWFLSSKFNVEYEYILTNGEMDIDKITAKRKRKRILNFKCANIERMGKYHPAEHANGSYSSTYVICNVDENSMFAVIRQEKGLILVIFSPNEKIVDGMKKFLPRQVSRDAFDGN